MNVDKKLLGQLVCGSENINQMRQEIEMLVPMITSLCGRSRPDQEFELDQTIDAGDFYWQVHYRLGLELMKRSWWAQCFKKGCGGGFRFGDRKTYSATGDRHLTCNNEEVQDMWETLPRFIEGMFEFFPGLEKELQPFLAAADAFKPAA